MSAPPEELVPVEASPAPVPAPAEDVPLEPAAEAEAEPPFPASAEAEASQPSAQPPAQKAASSPLKKIARPAKPRSSVPGKGKKADGEPKSFRPGDIVLARLKGYPPWPSRIADPDSLPRNVQAQRPGKSPHIYCVQFFTQGDFSWLQSREINHLSAHEIEAYVSESHRKAAGGLMEAYQTAQDPTEWDAGQANARAAKEEREAAEAEDVDELEDEEEEVTGGKRKRSAGGKKEKKKKARTSKKKKGVSSAEPPESEEDTPAPKKKAPTKPKSKPAKAPESKPAAADKEPADDDPLASDPECIKVKDWRHKLQRGFLGKGLPTSEEMDTYDSIFKIIEEYKTMTIEALQYSKIGKVMRKIATLDGIPRNEDLKITQRASKLMNEWTTFISSNGGKANGSEAAEAKKEEVLGEPKPEANGDKMEVDT